MTERVADNRYTDEELAKAMQAGDEEAGNVLIRRYSAMMRGKSRIYFIVGAEEDDVIQEALIGFLKAMRTYEDSKGAKFYTYAEHCVNHQLLDAVKAAKRKKHAPLNESVSLNQPTAVKEDGARLQSGGEPLGAYIATVGADFAELQIVLDKVMAYVSDNETGAFSDLETEVWKYYLAGKSYSEIAELLGKEKKVVSNAMDRTRKKVLQYLNED